MPLRRVYLPLSPAVVTALPVTREIGPAPIMAYAVTPSMIRRGGALDDEELELLAPWNENVKTEIQHRVNNTVSA